MKRETLSIVVACALGAFIGTLLALEIATRFQYGSYLWGIGALFGGMVAYVAVDYAGVVRSYHETLVWQPNPFYWKAVAMIWLSLTFLEMYVMTFFGLLAFGHPETGDLDLIWQKSWQYIWAAALLFVATAVFNGFISLLINKYNHKSSQSENIAHWLRMQQQGYECIVLQWTIISSSAKGLWWLIMNLPRFVKVVFMVYIPLFVAGVFIYVHSSCRTLCFVDATLGTAIGYTYGSSITGAVAGIVLGFINYELVSVRWLKLAP